MEVLGLTTGVVQLVDLCQRTAAILEESRGLVISSGSVQVSTLVADSQTSPSLSTSRPQNATPSHIETVLAAALKLPNALISALLLVRNLAAGVGANTRTPIYLATINSKTSTVKKSTSKRATRSSQRIRSRLRSGTGADSRAQDSHEDDANNENGDDDDDDGHSEDENGSTSRPSSQKQPFACPFYKHNGVRYMSCSRLRLARIRDVKQHLQRRHRRPMHCPICGDTFNDSQRWDTHIRERNCQAPPGGIDIEGITESQTCSLARRVNRSHSEKGQWYSIWEIVFPGEGRPDSPYLHSQLEECLGMVHGYWQGNRDELVNEVLGPEPRGSASHDQVRALSTQVLETLFWRLRNSSQEPMNLSSPKPAPRPLEGSSLNLAGFCANTESPLSDEENASRTSSATSSNAWHSMAASSGHELGLMPNNNELFPFDLAYNQPWYGSVPVPSIILPQTDTGPGAMELASSVADPHTASAASLFGTPISPDFSYASMHSSASPEYPDHCVGSSLQAGSLNPTPNHLDLQPGTVAELADNWSTSMAQPVNFGHSSEDFSFRSSSSRSQLNVNGLLSPCISPANSVRDNFCPDQPD